MPDRADRERKGPRQIGLLLPRQPKAITPAQRRLVNLAAHIYDNPPARDDQAYMARQLVQATLPYSDPGDVPTWSRRNGYYTLSIQPGYDTENACIGYPYGAVPRLVLFWITREALIARKNGDGPRIHLGRSLSKFMLDIGMAPESDGQKSGRKALRSQLRRLFRARISFLDGSGNGSRERWRNMDVAPDGDIWWDYKNPGQRALFGSWIELGEKFFHAITQYPIPVDLRVLRAFKKSPFALDLYALATYEAYRANTSGKPRFIPWSGLKEQLGADFKNEDEFRRKARAALRKIKTFYPCFNLNDNAIGLTIPATAYPAIAPPRDAEFLPVPTQHLK
jgi:hypothetical protein